MLFTVIDYIAISVFILLFTLIIASTIYDVIVKITLVDAQPLFTSFSLCRNGKQLVKLEPKTLNSIECFHGLRALSAFWVIGGHRIARRDFMVTQPVKMDIWFFNVIIGVFSKNDYAVDVFFLITGVLISRSCLKSLQVRKLNLLKMYSGRYLRYIPTLAVILLFFVSSFPTLVVNGTTGPTITWLNTEAAHCHKYWWSSLLLIQNYVNIYEICMNVTWYLSADFQLIVLSPLFIFLLWKFKYKTFWLLAVIILSTQIGIFFLSYNNSSSIALASQIYKQTHFRIAQFLIGIALGYIMYERSGQTHMKRRSLLFGWVITLSIFLAVNLCREAHTHFSEAFYQSVHRIAWTILMSWIIYVCHHLKSGGIVNWYLSLPLWQPIARISLSIYLIHEIYIILSIVNMEDRWNLNSAWLIHIICGDIAISTLLGAVVYLFIEGPSNLVVKYFI